MRYNMSVNINNGNSGKISAIVGDMVTPVTIDAGLVSL